MNFYLSNEHRKYMGLKPLKSNYDLVKIKKGKFEEYYLFFNGSKIEKVIYYNISNRCIQMREDDVNYETTENRSIVLPKTDRGKQRKLNGSAIDSFNSEGNYFWISKTKGDKYGNAIIGNYTTQRTFYSDKYIEHCSNLEDIEKWCNEFVKNSTEEDLLEVQEFSKGKRQHINYKEGDYFRVKLGRNQYTYGRILLDIYKGNKNKSLNYWNRLMGRALIVEIFHILTDRKDVSIHELKNLKTFPAQHIMDNNLYYGDYEIIGNNKLPDNVAYTIMYGIDFSNDGIKITFQCGKIHLEIPYEEKKFYGYFYNNGSGFHIDEDEKLITQCLKENSNKPYWEKYGYREDLRNPKYREILLKILKDLKLENLTKLYIDEI